MDGAEERYLMPHVSRPDYTDFFDIINSHIFPPLFEKYEIGGAFSGSQKRIQEPE
jgi:hypothetical protein